MSGFCHFGLVFFMLLWQSPDTPDMSCFHVSVLEPCALSSACLVSCSDPSTRVLSFGFVPGFRHSRSMFCLVVWVCGLECARAVRSLVCMPCFVFGSQHSCLEFRFRVGVQTLALRVLSCCVSVRSGVVRSLVWGFCFVLESGVRIPALVSWVSVSCRGSDTRAPCSVLLCECAVSSVLEPCALSSACLVLCSDPGTRVFRVGVQTLALRVLSCCVSVRSRVCSTVCSSVYAVCVLSVWLLSVHPRCYPVSCSVLLCECAFSSVLGRVLFCLCSLCFIGVIVISSPSLLPCVVSCLVVWTCGPECARIVRSLVWVFCFVLESGVRIPALMSWVSVSCRGSDTRSVFCLVVWACGLECARIVRSLVWVFCFVLERGVRIPALVSWVSVSCRGSDTRAPCSVLLCERAVSSVLGRVLFCLCSLCFIGVIVISSPSLLPCVVSCLALPSRVASLVSPTVCFVYLY